MPKGLKISANKPGQMIVSTAHMDSAGQKPKRANKRENAANMGNVGATDQNVYQGCFPCGCFSTYSQVSADKVTSGSEASNAPRRSLRFANSDTATTMAAVNRYFRDGTERRFGPYQR